ncbi:MAG: tetratricopeptide repeat protein [Candidatus Melainabacteria bacterium]|nr:tetratricopeptide repeat protein [Candidatus Melainabacteria bacterium]
MFVKNHKQKILSSEKYLWAYAYIICFLLSLFLLSSSNICFAKKQNELYPIIYFEQGVRYHKQGDLKSAVLSLNNALTLNPNDLSTLVELGEVFIELSKFDLAISTLQHAVSLAPDDALIHVLLGSAYLENKKHNDAISEFKLAVKLEPENTLLRSNVGLVCSLTGDHKCSVDNLGKVVLAYPFQLRVRAALGTAYHSMKDYALAKEQYKFVLEYEPDNLSLWYNLAKSEVALGNYTDAKESINKAISIDSSVSELYLDRAVINYKLNDLEGAQNDYLTALGLDPLNPSIPSEYGTFLWRTGAYLKASEQFDKALSLETDNKDFMMYKAYLLQLAKQDKNAISAWQNVLNEDAENQLALFNLAKLYQEKESYSNAIDLYKKILVIKEKLKEEDLETKSALAYCLQKNKNFDEARSIYENCLSVKPDDPVVLFNLGILLNDEKNYKDAVVSLEKSIKNGFLPQAKAYQALVLAYSSLNDVPSLKATYKNWLGVDKDNVEARIAYAKFLAKNGDSHEAIDQYRVAAALDNTSKSKYKLAQFLLEQKDLYGAVGQLQEYLKLEPNDLNALILLANSYKDLGIQEEAINTYKKIISLQYDNHLAYYNLGLLYQNDKKYEEAQNCLLKAIELNEKYSPAYYALGLSYIAGNNGVKAKELFQKYLEIDPNGEYKANVEARLKELSSKTQPPA